MSHQLFDDYGVKKSLDALMDLHESLYLNYHRSGVEIVLEADLFDRLSFDLKEVVRLTTNNESIDKHIRINTSAGELLITRKEG